MSAKESILKQLQITNETTREDLIEIVVKLFSENNRLKNPSKSSFSDGAPNRGEPNRGRRK